MEKDKGPLSWLKKLLSNESSEKKSGKYQYLLLVLLFGAAIMVISNLFLKQDVTNKEFPVFNNTETAATDEDVETFGQKKSQQNDIMTDYEDKYESQLKEALEGILGVGEVTVVVNVDSTEKKVLEKNRTTQTQSTEEEDNQGGKRKVDDSSQEEQPVIIRNGEKEVPIVVETKKPEIRGVLVVAKGADNIQVKSWIVESVTRVLGVPSHRVAVMPKKN
jgi:stage III sporulation protein AG